LIPPGGRFNFGRISSYYKDFYCLYIANDYDTAYREKYSVSEERSDNLSNEEFYLRKPGSFSHYRINLRLSDVLDARIEENLNGFCRVISDIQPAKEFQKMAKKLGFGELKTIRTPENLKTALHEGNFQQWSIFADQPSPSQWFGHYVRTAGLQGIIYNSTKNSAGFNIAVYPDQLTGDCFVELADETNVKEHLRKITEENFREITV
jgi:hypothetical protein